jgi:CheY-like chemotaxis protein
LTCFSAEAGQWNTVLIVDDEELVRHYLERILVGGGYRVITATSGEEAFSFCTLAVISSNW